MCAEWFAPFQELAGSLLPLNAVSGDGSHDRDHLLRVWRNAVAIQAGEGGNLELIVAGVLLHDCVDVPKDSPLRASASKLSGEKARRALEGLRWESNRTDVVVAAIESHSFSAGIVPASLEGRILQDADRLDAIGLLGVARCFYTAGKLGSKLYDSTDPRGAARPLDDSRFALDHFPRKLLRLMGEFQTNTGTRIAQKRHVALEAFYHGLLAEIGE
jgi:uncharacterized protein